MRIRDSHPCACGCGGEVKPGNRYLHGHGGRRFQVGTENIRWKGDGATRDAIHKWLHKHWPLTGTCEECGATGGRTEYSNVDHQWRRERGDYRELCSRCHRHFDYENLDTPNPCFDRSLAPTKAAA